MIKATSGRAGAVRIEPLKMNDLARAEKHGKRLDDSSQSRAIYPDKPPRTTTGLDLKNLYLAHVDGIYMPKNNTKALHVIVQFPTDLVDGEDANYMLKHARGFAEKVFGSRAVFADRVDRDERGRHIVDLFVTPIYTKKTKHSEKDAVGLSVHTKALANKHYPPAKRPKKKDGKPRDINVYDIGRALQDELIEYFQNDMGLTEAIRGSRKLAPGPDWKSAEELRLEELGSMKGDAERRRQAAEQLRVEAALAEAAAIELKRQAEAEQLRQASVAAELKLAAQAAEQARDQAVSQQQVADETRAEALKDRQEAERLRLEMEDRMRRSTESVRVAQEQARQLLVEAQQEVATARKEAEEVGRERRKLREEREALNMDRQRDVVRLDLLERAMDDRNGLRLRTTKDSFVMEPTAMTPPEREAYDGRWPRALFEIARRLASILEAARRLLKNASDEKRSIEQTKVEAEKMAADVAAKEAALGSAERDLNRRAAAIALEVEAAGRTLRSVQGEQQTTAEWGKIFDLLTAGQMDLVRGPNGKPRLRPAETLVVEPWLDRRLRSDPPVWAQRALDNLETVAEAALRIDQQEQRVAEQSATLQRVIEQAHRAFTPEQCDAVDAAKKAVPLQAQHQAAFAARRGSGRA